MRHFQYLAETQINRIFEVAPGDFSRDSDRETLSYALGATLYMPSYKKIVEKLLNKELQGLTSFVMCFEDAIREEDVERGEENVRNTLRSLTEAVANGILEKRDIPLFFVRIRNMPQFFNFAQSLSEKEAHLLSGFVFPKFNSQNGEEYLSYLVQLNERFNTRFYAMPILETPEIIYQETRMTELTKIKALLNRYRDFILNVRVGGTDFSSLFSLRRGIDYTIYDLAVVADCLKDILNLLMRAEDGFVVSAPVWEYFTNQRLLKPRLRETPFHKRDMLVKRQYIIDKAIDGLIRELILDKANGFVGKTIIHPSHISYVNAFQVVTKEEYDDALMIVKNQGGGVQKSSQGNKMNEMNPHLSWAKKILAKAKIYGVVKENDGYIDLF